MDILPDGSVSLGIDVSREFYDDARGVHEIPFTLCLPLVGSLCADMQRQSREREHGIVVQIVCLQRDFHCTRVHEMLWSERFTGSELLRDGHSPPLQVVTDGVDCRIIHIYRIHRCADGEEHLVCLGEYSAKASKCKKPVVVSEHCLRSLGDRSPNIIVNQYL